MKKLTFKKAHELHVALWGWLAETGNSSKYIWPEWVICGGKIPHVLNCCFACELCKDKDGLWAECNKCSVAWTKDPQDNLCEISKKSPYRAWKNAAQTNDRKKYAAIIRDLPWRKK